MMIQTRLTIMEHRELGYRSCPLAPACSNQSVQRGSCHDFCFPRFGSMSVNQIRFRFENIRCGERNIKHCVTLLAQASLFFQYTGFQPRNGHRCPALEILFISRVDV